MGVAEELNFARAEERLHIVHSLLGYEIGHLEDEPEDGEWPTALSTASSQARLLTRAIPAPLLPTPDIVFEPLNT